MLSDIFCLKTVLQKKVQSPSAGPKASHDLEVYTEWADKWDRRAFILVFASFLFFILLYTIICAATS